MVTVRSSHEAHEEGRKVSGVQSRDKEMAHGCITGVIIFFNTFFKDNFTVSRKKSYRMDINFILTEGSLQRMCFWEEKWLIFGASLDVA